MKYNISKSIKIPAYIQLYNHLKSDIVSGLYQYCTKFPSKRVISVDSSLSLVTVEHAIELLCDEGYLESVNRVGYFVIYKSDDFRNFSKKDDLEESLNLAENIIEKNDSIKIKSKKMNEEITFPFSVMSKMMRRVLSEYGEYIFSKSPNKGCMELRYEICSYLARSRGIFVNSDQVVIGSGAEYLYGLIAQMIGNDKVFAIENPSYNKISQVYTSLGINVDLLTLKNEGIDSEELRRTKAKVLHTTPFHSFPTGISVSVSKKNEYIKWAEKGNNIIIEDNYDSELTVSSKSEDSLFSLSNGNHVIYLNTFSKTIAPSMRIGYMILPLDMLTKYNKISFYSCSVPVFEQLVLAGLLKNGDFERHINRIRRKKRKMLTNKEND